MSTNGNGNKLNDGDKRFVCRMYAEWATPTEAANALKAERGKQISVPGAHWYKTHEPWKSLIVQFRKELEKKIDELPIASKFWRLQQLERLFRECDTIRVVRYVRSGGTREEPKYTPIEAKDTAECRNILRQAAEELGELRQVHEHSGPGGEPIVTRQVILSGGEVIPSSVAGVSATSPPEFREE